MGLEEELCRKAHGLQWKVAVEGDILDLNSQPAIEIKKWMDSSAARIGIGRHLFNKDLFNTVLTFGFIDPDTSRTEYHPFAEVYPGRLKENDYHAELLRALFLNLRKAAPPAATIYFPPAWVHYLTPHHLSLLDKENQEVLEFRPGKVPIYDSEDISLLCESCRVRDQPRD